MIKVCHVTSVHTSKDPRIFYKMCTSLVNNGYDVYHVAPGESREENGVKIIGVGEKPDSRLKRMISFTKKVYKKALEVDADIYHIHDPELLRYGRKLKKMGKVVIFDSHEDVPAQILEKEWIPFFIRRATSFVYSAYEKAMLKKMDYIICVSPNYLDNFTAYNKNCSVICNFPIVDEDYREPAFDNNNLVFAGAINDNWSQIEIINSLELLKKYKVSYNLLGSAEDNFLNELKSLLGWNHVNYFGRIPYKEVQKHLSNSCLGIVLHKYTPNVDMTMGTLGNTKIFECLALGIPVICTDFTLWKEIIDKYNCGIYISPNNESQLVDAITKLINNREMISVMSKNARTAIIEEYNWKLEEQKLLSIYKILRGSVS